LANNQDKLGDVMPRKRNIKTQLDDEGILTDEDGVEYARMSLNGLLIINDLQLYFDILRAPTDGQGYSSVAPLNKKYSQYGNWGVNPTVNSSLIWLHAHGFIDLIYKEDKAVKVRAKRSALDAINNIPPYKTRAEIMAGLEPILKEDNLNV
jgi:hypothetical protein